MKSNPNILLIVSDQCRADFLGCYGNSIVQTPNLDGLCREGMKFERAYVSNPLCMPSRATILTGRYPSTHRVRSNGIPLPGTENTLPLILAENGYATAAIGKIHLTPTCSHGYEESRSSWEDDKMNDWHGPYYGFQFVNITHGHYNPGGHHLKWVKDNYPDALSKYGKQNAISTGNGFGQTWHSAAPEEAHSSSFVGEETVRYLKERKSKSNQKPFFLWAGFPDPHHPFDPPEPYASIYSRNDMPDSPMRKNEFDDMPPHYRDHYINGMPNGNNRKTCIPADLSDQGGREIKALTYGMMTLMDKNIGRILDCLEELDIAKDTIVIFTSDHGELFGDHGLYFKGPYMYDSLLKVPLIWRFPEYIKKGATDALFSHVDLMQTLLEIVDVCVPSGVQGISQKDVLTGDKKNVRDWALTEYVCEITGQSIKCLQKDEWKLTYYAGQEYGELFDKKSDPNEYFNLYIKPEYKKIRDMLEKKLLDIIIETEDKLPECLGWS